MTKSIFFQRLSATVQFILGFILGVSLIAGLSGTVIFAYYKKMSVLPKKPAFDEVPLKESPADAPKSSASIEPLESNAAEDKATEELESEPESKPELELPPNAYRAEVTWPEGLSLRAEPSLDAERVGGVSFEEKIFILEDSADGSWQRVIVPGSEQEGWVKGGNTERTPD
jgi:hypothetical protein